MSVNASMRTGNREPGAAKAATHYFGLTGPDRPYLRLPATAYRLPEFAA